MNVLKPQEKIQHYNDCIQLCEHAADMFMWLDKYRKTGDKRQLFATKDHEKEIRKLLTKILNDNNKLFE